MHLFIGCYTEKWYEISQEINKHENAAFTLFKIFLMFQPFCKSDKETQKFLMLIYKDFLLHLFCINFTSVNRNPGT